MCNGNNRYVWNEATPFLLNMKGQKLFWTLNKKISLAGYCPCHFSTSQIFILTETQTVLYTRDFEKAYISVSYKPIIKRRFNKFQVCSHLYIAVPLGMGRHIKLKQ